MKRTSIVGPLPVPYVSAALFVTGVIASWPILQDACDIGWNNPDAGHILLAPLATIYLAWKARAAWTLPGGCSWGGSLPIAITCLIAFTGLVTDTRVLWHAGGIVLPFAASLAVLARPARRAIMPAAASVLFMVPVPGTIDAWLTTPLVNLQVHTIGSLAELFGWNLMIDGQTIVANGVEVIVEHGCAGFRIFWPVMIVTWASCFCRSMSARRRILILAAVPCLALILNILRLIVTIGIYTVLSPSPAGLVHDVLGIAIIVIAPLVPLLAVGMQRGSPGSIQPEPERLPANCGPEVLRGRFPAVGALILLCALVGAMLMFRTEAVAASGQSKESIATVKMQESVPYRLGDWIGDDVPLSPSQLTRLQPDALIHRRYQKWDTRESFGLLIASHLDGRNHAGHSADRCYPAAGWTWTMSRERQWQFGHAVIHGREHHFSRCHPATAHLTVVEFINPFQVSGKLPDRNEWLKRSTVNHSLTRVQLLFADDGPVDRRDVEHRILQCLDSLSAGFFDRRDLSPEQSANISQ